MTPSSSSPSRAAGVSCHLAGAGAGAGSGKVGGVGGGHGKCADTRARGRQGDTQHLGRSLGAACTLPLRQSAAPCPHRPGGKPGTLGCAPPRSRGSWELVTRFSVSGGPCVTKSSRGARDPAWQLPGPCTVLPGAGVRGAAISGGMSPHISWVGGGGRSGCLGSKEKRTPLAAPPVARGLPVLTSGVCLCSGGPAEGWGLTPGATDPNPPPGQAQLRAGPAASYPRASLGPRRQQGPPGRSAGVCDSVCRRRPPRTPPPQLQVPLTHVSDL